jgi:hypothetical protein
MVSGCQKPRQIAAAVISLHKILIFDGVILLNDTFQQLIRLEVLHLTYHIPHNISTARHQDGLLRVENHSFAPGVGICGRRPGILEIDRIKVQGKLLHGHFGSTLLLLLVRAGKDSNLEISDRGVIGLTPRMYRFDFLDATLIGRVADHNMDVGITCRLLDFKHQKNCDFTFFCFDGGGV